MSDLDSRQGQDVGADGAIAQRDNRHVQTPSQPDGVFGSREQLDDRSRAAVAEPEPARTGNKLRIFGIVAASATGLLAVVGGVAYALGVRPSQAPPAPEAIRAAAPTGDDVCGEALPDPYFLARYPADFNETAMREEAEGLGGATVSPELGDWTVVSFAPTDKGAPGTGLAVYDPINKEMRYMRLPETAQGSDGRYSVHMRVGDRMLRVMGFHFGGPFGEVPKSGVQTTGTPYSVGSTDPADIAASQAETANGILWTCVFGPEDRVEFPGGAPGQPDPEVARAGGVVGGPTDGNLEGVGADEGGMTDAVGEGQ